MDTKRRIYIGGFYVKVRRWMFITVDVYAKAPNTINKLASLNEPKFAVDLFDSTLTVK
ncbi:MAG: hypothetical protein R3C18_21930 [Planctomycetaceae bacterium]